MFALLTGFAAKLSAVGISDRYTLHTWRMFGGYTGMAFLLCVICLTSVSYFLEHPVHLKKANQNWSVWLICVQTLMTLLSFAL